MLGEVGVMYGMVISVVDLAESRRHKPDRDGVKTAWILADVTGPRKGVQRALLAPIMI